MKNTVFPHIRPAGIIDLCSLQMRVLLENSTFLLHLLRINYTYTVTLGAVDCLS